MAAFNATLMICAFEAATILKLILTNLFKLTKIYGYPLIHHHSVNIQ